MTENNHIGSVKITKANPPTRQERLSLRLLIFLGSVSLIVFVIWFFSEDRVGNKYLYWPLTFAFLYKLFRKVHEWYHYYDLSVPKPLPLKRKYTVDILTTWCPGEPREMVISTLKAMQAITYPHTSFLCDEGDDAELKQVCKDLGVIHVTRTLKKNAKAGNINNALENHAKGEIAIVMDPDHVPIPEFIDRVLPYFQDPKIGYVQCVQAYVNRRESLVALGAAEQTYHFYGPMMMCMNSYGTVQAIGANCAFRRSALDSIGGHAAGLSEDMHTAMRLHSKGWKSIYVPEILTRGLVPATMSGYVKQQLKWSRGTFDLLFYYLPALLRNLTFRQKIHYITLPFHFLCGLITAIDIFIPIASLLMADAPWLVKFTEFSAYCTPMIVISLLIRMYVQRWLLEPHERGFHLVGGLLRIGTWWVFLLGFIYTIFRIKVPYIPTPKDDKPHNDWMLSLPNIAVILLSIFAIIYGLNLDWSPYSICMSLFAMVNISILSYNVIISQQKLLVDIYSLFQDGILKTAEYRTRLLWWYIRHSFYFLLRHASVIFSVAGVVFVGVYILIRLNDNILQKLPHKAVEKKSGNFYAGISSYNNVLPDTKTNLNLDVIQCNWDKHLISDINRSIHNAQQKNKFIFLRFPAFPSDSNEIQVCNQIKKMLMHTDIPVFIGFTDLNQATPEIEKDKWIDFVTDFRSNGIGNVVWVWQSPQSNHSDFYPGNSYVDWIEVSYRDKVNKSGREVYFSEVYRPYRKFFLWVDKPVIITDIRSELEDNNNPLLQQTLSDIRNHHEIKGIIFQNSTHSKISVKVQKFLSGLVLEQNNHSDILNKEYSETTKNTQIAGNYRLPAEIKGVVYNLGDAWSDEDMPLTRKRVESDLTKISDMGANTIRRYKPSIFDHNIFTIAEEKNLNIIYGIWFDPQIDYSNDSMRVQELLEELEGKVNDYKNNASLMAWCLGHETIKELSYYYDPPYLNRVKYNYFRFLEIAARRIKSLDNKHPVICALEYNYDISTNLSLLKNCSPSVDIAGMNIYDKTDLNSLDRITTKYFDKSYTVLQFGTTPGKNSGSLLVSGLNDNSTLSENFRQQWNFCKIATNRKIPGGIAFCWTDESYDKNNWNGISDFKGRLKPVYYTFRSIYKGIDNTQLFANVKIDGPDTPVAGGQEYEFSAVPEDKATSEYKYEWHFSADNYYYNPSGIRLMEKGKKIKVFIPQIPADYMLYLSVSDEKGNVFTSAVPVRIKK